MTTAIWWIRRDLRLADNPALTHAMSRADKVVPLFVLDPQLLESRSSSQRRIAFLLEGLRKLDRDLRFRGSRLVVRHGEPQACLADVAVATNAVDIVAEEDFSPYAVRRDTSVADSLSLTLVSGVTVAPPGSVVKSNGDPYVVYAPFGRAWRALAPPHRDDVFPAPDRLALPPAVAGEPIPDEPRIPENLQLCPGEDEAQRRLQEFTDGLWAAGEPRIHVDSHVHSPPPAPTNLERSGAVFRYASQRDRIDVEGTSHLSPYLRFGMISARQAVVAAMSAIAQSSDPNSADGAETWLRQLIWREFYVHILAQFPHVAARSFREDLREVAWSDDSEDIAAWCDGRTGYPVVDAAMRQLAATGWIHNRCRMIVASFLVKDLLVDWRHGERHFMQHLVDGDPAANNGGWQWAAGTGTDSAPYFRVFNPVLQGKKSDPRGAFVRRWLPELARVSNGLVHSPWEMTAEQQRSSGCRIGHDYPAPIVDHAHARRRAIAAYDVARKAS